MDVESDANTVNKGLEGQGRVMNGGSFYTLGSPEILQKPNWAEDVLHRENIVEYLTL